MKTKIVVGIIGLGARGQLVTAANIIPMCKMDVEIATVCDAYEDRAKMIADTVEETTGQRPFLSTDYHDVLAISAIDAIMIFSAWEAHIPIALAAMRAGKYVGVEVGGAYSLEDCWDLVRTSEETGMPWLMLENCCYGRRELMVLNMQRLGVLGEVVYCTGAYAHDLRQEIADGRKNRHYRLRNYLNRNCDNYPTHALGPIAKILNINRGNRFLTVSSAASCSKGMKAYLNKREDADPALRNHYFRQGDVITTTIRCAGGEVIVLTLDTTLPRAYSRGLSVSGTKGQYTEMNDSIFIDGRHNEFDFEWHKQWGNAKEFEEEYDHPIWREYRGQEVGGHDGMDWLVIRAFIESVKRGIQPPIDVYDTAAWMCISVLSEMSISRGGAVVDVPDFTGGGWIEREPQPLNKYTLDTIVDDPHIQIFPKTNHPDQTVY